MSRRLAARPRLNRPQWTLSIGAALAIIGFVGAAQWNSSDARQEFITSAQRVLISEAQQAQSQQESLRSQIQDAEAQVRGFQEQAEGSVSLSTRLSEQVEAARLATGLEAVRGPGAVVEIADSQRSIPAGENASNYLVLVDDLRDLITALWASGAEAIVVAGGGGAGGPGERLVSTTSIYGAGSAILINTTLLSPPYRIEAIGPDGLHDRFLVHPTYITRVAKRIEAYGLQFASEPRDELTLPAFIGNTRLRWGAPVAEAN